MAAGQPLTTPGRRRVTTPGRRRVTTGFVKAESKALFFMNLIDVQNHATLKWGRDFKVISPNSHLEQKHSHCPRPDIGGPAVQRP